ncbi:hypothetical protein [Bartonella sp. ML69XJBT]|uniref:hypothetical protein n=1 Tax=Bartonella sp. ML69XJBT TaxID=3019092 RepID=UPI00235ED670|nr:hypothetical protein [Bartonella sp. ML69XJBT]
MSDKQPLHTFSSICKSKPVYNYTITGQEIKSLQHNAKIESGCCVAIGFLVVILALVVIWTINNGDDWRILPILLTVVLFLMFLLLMLCGTLSNSEEIWKNVQQVSEVICEKK